jgi:hypothetical protein
MQISAGNIGSSLQQASRGSSGGSHRMRRFIVVAEVALSLVLICGASLLFRSLMNLRAVETGVRIENVVTMSLNLPLQAYPTPAESSPGSIASGLVHTLAVALDRQWRGH